MDVVAPDDIPVAFEGKPSLMDTYSSLAELAFRYRWSRRCN